MSKYCKACGNQMQDQEMFCAKCGTKSEVIHQPISTFGIGKINEKYLKIGIIIASLLMILASIIPYMEIEESLYPYLGMSKPTISLVWAGTQIGDGIIYIILAILSIVFVCLNKRLPEVIFSAIAFLMCCVEVKQINDNFKQLEASFGNYALIEKRAGFYLIIISTAAMLVLSILYFLRKKMADKNA